MSSHTCYICNNEYKTEKTLATHIRKMHTEREKQQAREREKLKVEESDADSDSDSSVEQEQNNKEKMTMEDLIRNYVFLVKMINVLHAQTEITVETLKKIKETIYDSHKH